MLFVKVLFYYIVMYYYYFIVCFFETYFAKSKFLIQKMSLSILLVIFLINHIWSHANMR